jgi:LmbE family N-acetylglucosaminyl deacetylase
VVSPAPAAASALEIRTGGLVVVAPHPDDEALIAGGAIARAVANGEPVAVLILTSGDFDCRSAASQRQAESIAGLEALGVKEDQVFFLGYVLEFDGQALQISLAKHTAAGLESLAQWPLPHDAWTLPEHGEHFELQVTADSSDHGAAALTLLREDVVVGVAIDPNPPRGGNVLSVDDPSGSRGGVLLSLGPSGAGRVCRR